MYVYNLPPDTNEMMLLQLFCQYGAILNARPMMDYTTGQCKVHLLITTRLTTVTFLSPLARLTTVVPNTAPPLAAYPPPPHPAADFQVPERVFSWLYTLPLPLFSNTMFSMALSPHNILSPHDDLYFRATPL